MQDTDLFQMALGLFPPWVVERCTLDPEQKQLDIFIDFSRGGESMTFQQHHVMSRQFRTSVSVTREAVRATDLPELKFESRFFV
jgi:hypothetical protein